MKLSQLSTDRAFDALCRLTPYIANITEDPQLVEAVGKIVRGDGLNVYGYGLMLAQRAGEILPLLLEDHRQDVYGILSVLNEREVGQIAAQPVAETLAQAMEVFQDKELADFFSLYGRQGRSA